MDTSYQANADLELLEGGLDLLLDGLQTLQGTVVHGVRKFLDPAHARDSCHVSVTRHHLGLYGREKVVQDG